MLSLLASLPLILAPTGGYQDGVHWKLAFNIHPSDGHNFGYGADAWDDDKDVGTDEKAFKADYKSHDVTIEIANFVAIVRHQNGACEAARVWKFLEPGNTLRDYLDIKKTSRLVATSPNYIYSYISPSMEAKNKDPLFAVDDGALTFNWWYSNNGARIANSKTYYAGGLPAANMNDDSYHGLGGEFGANTQHGGSSTTSWYDVGVYQGECSGNSCAIQGTDHGTSFTDGKMYGQYAIYTSDEADTFPCKGKDLETSILDPELVELAENFERADKSSNGFVDFEEMIFEVADLDGDGALSSSEYSKARSFHRFDGKTSSDKDMVIDFSRIDKNGNLLLTIDEIAFDIADTNKDSELSLEEFARARSRAGSRLGNRD